MAPEISLGGNFSYDKYGEFYSTTTIYGYIKKEGVKESYKTLMAILNSQFFWWYLVNTGTVLANGYFRYKPNYINPFPIPDIPIKFQKQIDLLVEEIYECKRNKLSFNIDAKLDQINDIIFNLYELNEEEIKIVNSIK